MRKTSKRGPYRKLDLTGRVFGRLTVLAEVGKNHNKKIMWLCRCECGVEKAVPGETLRAGSSNSCGCLRTEMRRGLGERIRKPDGVSGFNSLLNNYKHRSSKYGREWELSEDEFRHITSQNCFYCDREPSQISVPSSILYEETRIACRYIFNGIDRVDTSRGYTVDNVVPCCKFCNTAKSNLSLSDFYTLIEKIYLNRPWA